MNSYYYTSIGLELHQCWKLNYCETITLFFACDIFPVHVISSLIWSTLLYFLKNLLEQKKSCVWCGARSLFSFDFVWLKKKIETKQEIGRTCALRDVNTNIFNYIYNGRLFFKLCIFFLLRALTKNTHLMKLYLK